MLSCSSALFQGRIAPGGPRPAAFGPPGGAAAGFWWARRRTQSQQQGGKGAADTIRRETFRPLPAFPRQPLIGNTRPGQAQLGVRRDEQRGPAIGLFGMTYPRQHPVQGLLTEAEGMLQIEAADVRAPQHAQVWGA